jgi:hypothetical protein
MASPTLQEQAYLEALGFSESTAGSTEPDYGTTSFPTPSAAPNFAYDQRTFAAGVVDEIQLLGYYPVTREMRDLSAYVSTITYTEAEGQAGIMGELDFYDPAQPGALLDDAARKSLQNYIALVGLTFIFSTRADGAPFAERQRWINWNPVVGAPLDDTVQFYDNLVYLANAECSVGYQNLTASEITANICQIFGIPVGSIVQATYKIPYFLFTGSIYDAIATAYAFERHMTGKYFYITVDRGKLIVRRVRSVLHDAKDVFLLDPATNVRNPMTFSRTLDQYAGGIIPTGTDQAGNAEYINLGTINPNSLTKTTSSVTPTASKTDVAAAEQAGLTKAQAEAAAVGGQASINAAEQANQLAASVLFGAFTFNRRVASIRDPAYSAKAAQLLSNRLARAGKELDLTADGNVLVRQGDRVHVLGYPLDLFISSITQTISRTDHTMQLALAWREFDVSDQEDYHAVQQAGAQYLDLQKQEGTKPSSDGSNSTSTPQGGYPNVHAWAPALLAALGDPATSDNVDSLVAWWGHEGGAGPQWGTNNLASYNPFNTTEPEDGSGVTGSQGDIAVYKNWADGITGTVATLRNGLYGDILANLKAGVGLKSGAATGLLKWSDGGYSSV